MRGRPVLNDVCRVCGITIVRIPRVTRGKRRKERLCNLCTTEKVLLKKWGKRSTIEIIAHLESLERTAATLRKILDKP